MQDSELEAYRERGYILRERLLPVELITRINDEVDGVLERARGITESDDVLDLEDTHTKDAPRVRRIKYPDRHCPSVRDIFADAGFAETVKAFLGPNVRLQTTKLNAKEAGYGAAVEWHQDWAFYPYTNDDVLAAGIMLDDVDAENGPLLVLGGSHRGPVHDHSADGVFCGAIDVEYAGLPVEEAKPILGSAGSVSFHHVRLVHGSSINRSQKRRRMLFIEMTAADSWPLAGGHAPFTTLEEFNNRMIYGEPTLEPRMLALPVRMPLPRPAKAGSIYEVQGAAKKRAFA